MFPRLLLALLLLLTATDARVVRRATPKTVVQPKGRSDTIMMVTDQGTIYEWPTYEKPEAPQVKKSKKSKAKSKDEDRSPASFALDDPNFAFDMHAPHTSHTVEQSGHERCSHILWTSRYWRNTIG